MRSAGERAPEFELRGTTGDGLEHYRLSEYLADGPVLLSFYPFDFSPACTTEVCELRDAEWFRFVDNLDIFGISTDGPYAHMAFSDRYGIDFPLLSDTDGSVAASYGTRYEEYQGFRGIIQRSTFLVDDDRTIRHVTSTADIYEDPDLQPIREAVRALGEPEPNR